MKQRVQRGLVGGKILATLVAALLGLAMLSVGATIGGCAKQKTNPEPPPATEKASDTEPGEAAAQPVEVTWYGHAMFRLTSGDAAVVVDPYDASAGYTVPKNVQADAVAVSHEHEDHNNSAAIGGNPAVVKTTGAKTVKGVKFVGFPAFHDPNRSKGAEIIMFQIELGQLEFAHLGDLGHMLSGKEVAELVQTDVLLIPVGGGPTIHARVAKQVVDKIKPKIVIPMHYKTPSLSFPLDPVENFTKLFPGRVVKKGSSVTIDNSKLPAETEIWVMDFKR